MFMKSSYQQYIPTVLVCFAVFLASIIEAMMAGTTINQAFIDPKIILVYLIAVAHIVFCKIIDNEWLDAFGHIYAVLLQIIVAVIA